MDNYTNVFIESARVASIIPFASEPTFFAMFYFGGFNMPLAAGLAVAGATVGMSFNWLVGKMLLEWHKKKSFNVNEYWYNKCAALFGKYGAILILLSWLPLMKFMLVAAGFLNVRYRFVLPLVVIGHVMCYGYFLFAH